MKNILLCPPDYYEIEYEINPWMHKENKIDKEKVKEEYQNLKSAYESLGAKVYEIPPVKGLPDMVYITNEGHVEGKTFIQSNFRYPQRQPEAQYAAEYFSKNFQFNIVKLPENVYFEGHGDLLEADDVFYLGWGKRSSLEAKDYLSPYLPKPIISLETIDPYFYHLDMCLAPLKDGVILINPRSFKKAGIDAVYSTAKKVIEVSEQDNQVMACNLVRVGDDIVLAKGISDVLRNQIEELGYKVHEVEMGEYMKGGGSVFCITLAF